MQSKRTKEATARFLELVDIVMKRDKLSQQDFAKSIGQLPQNFHKIKSGVQHVSTLILINFCKKYQANPTYILLGEGEKFLHDANKLEQLEKRVRKLELRK